MFRPLAVLQDDTGKTISCWVQGKTVLPPRPQPTNIVAGGREPALETVTVNGQQLRMYTSRCPAASQSPGQTLSDVTDPLNRLALILLIVAGIGVVVRQARAW